MHRQYGSYCYRAITGLLLACGALIVPAAAQAGFEWVPAPQKEEPPPAAPQMQTPAPAYDYGAPPPQQMAPYPYNNYYQPQPYPQQYGNVGYAPPPPVPTFPPQQMNYGAPQYAQPYYGVPAAQGMNFPNPIPPMMPPGQQQQASAPMAPPAGQEVMIKRGFEEPINVQASMKASSAGNAGLQINPYPLRNGGGSGVKANANRVESAMMEESRAVNPLPLGYGFSTGSKPRRLAPSAPAEAPMQQQMAMSAPQDAGMTPMPGGPVAPLPGFAAAPVERHAMAYQQQPDYPVQKAAPPPYQQEQNAWQQPQMSPAMAANPAPNVSLGFGEAVGFGKDLPLALALSQVIPPDHALFFETAVNAESNVSWQGGKPWNEVLQDMLAPLGLRAEIQPNLVMIRGA